MQTPIGSPNPLTYTEVHAVVLGGVVGVLVGYAYDLGYATLAAGFTGLFVLLALGVAVMEDNPAAQKTVRREPWYALAALLVGGVAGMVV